MARIVLRLCHRVFLPHKSPSQPSPFSLLILVVCTLFLGWFPSRHSLVLGRLLPLAKGEFVEDDEGKEHRTTARVFDGQSHSCIIIKADGTGPLDGYHPTRVYRLGKSDVDSERLMASPLASSCSKAPLAPSLSRLS